MIGKKQGKGNGGLNKKKTATNATEKYKNKKPPNRRSKRVGFGSGNGRWERVGRSLGGGLSRESENSQNVEFRRADEFQSVRLKKKSVSS